MSQHNPDKLDLATIRNRLRTGQGKTWWRSLEELAETSDFQDFLNHEFPRLASVWNAPVDRRTALKLMAASLALAGVTACSRQPEEEIVPYVQAPEQLVPGKPLYFATALSHGGYARGVLVESHSGRPTKVEGNPLHPASLGATDVFAQAAVLDVYDPDRSQNVMYQGRISTWDRFLAVIAEKRMELDRRQGNGLHILTETVISPTLGHQLKELLAQYPQARWHQYDPVGRDSVRMGARLAFDEPVETVYRFDKAAVIVSLDADFLGWMPGHLTYARHFIDGRRMWKEQNTMNRLYVLESTPTITGAMADHRLPVRASQVEVVARALAQRLGLEVTPSPEDLSLDSTWVDALIGDLEAHRGRCLVVTGEHQSPVVHALAQAINERLDNFGSTVIHTDPVEIRPVNQTQSLRELTEAMAAGEVDTLLILGGNPAFTAPADLNFAQHFQQVPLRIHWGLYQDETATHCHWHIPATHELETWSDIRAYEGTITIQQPLIAPLYGGRSVHELVTVLLGHFNQPGYAIVRDYWLNRYGGPDFERFWRKALQDGVVEDSAAPPREMALRQDLVDVLPAPHPVSRTLEIQFRPDPTIWDGRYLNNGWLQELPKPLTKLTWDNAALISPTTAERLGLQNEDLVELTYGQYQLTVPIWMMPGHADDSLTLYLGYGRSQVGQVGSGTGFNSYHLRTSESPWFAQGLKLDKTAGQYPLVTTQHHHSMEGRDLVRHLTLQQFQQPQAQDLLKDNTPHHSLYPEYDYQAGYSWGMAVDMNACIGCNACISACQAENNIPVVGKQEVARGHDMHWLRIDRYYAGSIDNPQTYFQPVPCMHCENAPCEYVCPVAATVHDAEGLNVMIYNRCIGTRNCSQNCPYKVRRFNWLNYNYTDEKAQRMAPVHNPDVTVRSRGVMEKCTYCIQRISSARIEAKKENRRIQDGEVVTACQAACPTRAIVFGDLNDPQSQVNRLKASPLDYALLAELNTRPRTTYQARLSNPNPEIEPPETDESADPTE